MPRQLRREEYTVGWVCALPIELAAAQEMLDEEHDDLRRELGDNDENSYILGSISGHNVVIVCLPAGRIGSNPAATVATQMRSTFKGIRFGLMVGIGGGVPSAEADIWLGDVVVSQPHQTFAGVVQYDMGKTTPSGFERTGSLSPPPWMLLGAVTRVRANEVRGRSKLSEYASKLGHKFRRTEAGPDVLFEATYDHKGGKTCERCSPDRQQTRPKRESGKEVVVHYGTIASGNQVIRDGRTRDKLRRELGSVLCFEMEAAGLVDRLPCLVIRGICDYADSHKNKRWQAYAAGTAAAYAKEVLSVIPAAEVAETRTVEEAMRGANDISDKQIQALFAKAQAQIESGESKLQLSAHRSASSKTFVQVTIMAFLSMLYGLLWTFATPTYRLSILDAYAISTLVKLDHAVSEEKEIRDELRSEEMIARCTAEELKEAEEQIQSYTEASKEGSETQSSKPVRAGTRLDEMNERIEDRSASIEDRWAQLEERIMKLNQERNVLEQTIKQLKNEQAQKDQKIAKLKKDRQHAEHLRVTSENKGYVKAVWDWIAWALGFGK
ncbi:purine and uridine phosphorylase [Byssothecium circinans]|uniref:Purine and uridine phosphorylase n=1 Tax=Byssothecium circinans TaxID=147558 RepID=A0A6A5U0F9_9PLEO|nr:purine and uridine phosphorylase [Byssothecium circinans]